MTTGSCSTQRSSSAELFFSTLWRHLSSYRQRASRGQELPAGPAVCRAGSRWRCASAVVADSRVGVRNSSSDEREQRTDPVRHVRAVVDAYRRGMDLADAATDVARLAESLKEDLFVHHAAITLARQPDALALLPPATPDALVAEGQLSPGVRYDLPHYLALAGQRGRQEQFERVWLAGALLTLGDALSDSGYFDRAPILETVRHLRNAVAHGNRFRILSSKQLAQYPAHTPMTSAGAHRWEITPELSGTEFMFAFMQPGDVVTVLGWVAQHLWHASLEPGLPQSGHQAKRPGRFVASSAVPLASSRSRRSAPSRGIATLGRSGHGPAQSRLGCRVSPAALGVSRQGVRFRPARTGGGRGGRR